MRKINQSFLFDTLIWYAENDRKKSADVNGKPLTLPPMTDDEKHEFYRGLCFGFSVVHSYMASTRKLEWWYAVLDKISEWNGDFTKIDEPFTLPRFEEKKVTMNELLQRVVSYVLFHQTQLKTRSFLSEQRDVLKIGDVFDSEHGKIRYSAVVSDVFTDHQLEIVLDGALFSQPGIFIIGNNGLMDKMGWFF